MEDNTIIQPDMTVELEELKKKEKKAAIINGLKTFGLKVGMTVAVGLASHYILKAILPDEDENEGEILEESDSND